MKFFPYPLGLPRGTVRAIITLIFFFTCMWLLFNDQKVPETLGNTILILISFYFGIKKGTVDTIKKQQDKGEISSQTTKEIKPTPQIQSKSGENAFNLPAKSVRFILFIGLMIIALKFLIQGSEIYDPVPQFIIDGFIIVTGFIFGTIYKKVTSRLPSEVSFLSKIIFHGKALTVVLLALTTSIYYLTAIDDPNLSIYAYITNLVVGFYFGSR